MAKAITAYIGLGSNLGDRQSYIRNAVKSLSETAAIKVTGVSSLIETAPLGNNSQPKYLNAVAEVETTLSADELLKKLIETEKSLGRKRTVKWAPRTIDLDILLYGDVVINRPDLTIPHSQMHLRSFILKGMCELNKDLLHPVLKVTMNELASRLAGCDYMINPELPQLICIDGVIGVGKTTLCRKLSEEFGCKAVFEPYDENPFMPDVYTGKKELALDSELFFLVSRAEQLHCDSLQKGDAVISDYVFDKELIFARMWLNGNQTALHEKIYPAFAAKIAVPVLVIYLQDSAENCLKRIHKRNRPYEQDIEISFLKSLEKGYELLFGNWKICPVMRVPTGDLDYSKEETIERLINQIKSYIAV